MVETEGKSQKELYIKLILVHLCLAHTPHDSRIESWFNSVYHGSLHMTTIHLPWYNSSDHGSLDMRTTNVQELNHGLILFAGFFVEV